MSLQENGRNFALKLRFDTGFDNGPSQAWIPQVNNVQISRVFFKNEKVRISQRSKCIKRNFFFTNVR